MNLFAQLKIKGNQPRLDEEDVVPGLANRGRKHSVEAAGFDSGILSIGRDNCPLPIFKEVDPESVTAPRNVSNF